MAEIEYIITEKQLANMAANFYTYGWRDALGKAPWAEVKGMAYRRSKERKRVIAMAKRELPIWDPSNGEKVWPDAD